LVTVPRDLSSSLFQGGVERQAFDTGEVDRRLYRNPSGSEYGPRVTYWDTTRTLKVEFSAQKMGGTVGQALDAVDEFLRDTFGELPGIRSWSVQRIDYAADLAVGDKLPLYVAALEQAQIAGCTRHPFSGAGIVWKSRGRRGRWVKFYTRADGSLRFEVSSYKDAARYMAERWFGCERTVEQMVKPGRALFALSREWERLGLGGDVFGHEVGELDRLRAVFGLRGVSSARYVLELHREFGAEAYRGLGLVSKATYYRRLAELRAEGFLVEGDEREALKAIELPCESVFDAIGARNLKSSEPPLAIFRPEKTWARLCGLLEISAKNRPNRYLLKKWGAYVQQNGVVADMVCAPGSMSAGGRKRAARRAGQSSTA